jgi:hypothetical protein
VPSAQIYLHPTLLARRAAEIAQSQGGRIGRDACGRPFVRSAADPLAEAPAPAAPPDPMRFERLIRALRALAAWFPSTEAPGRIHREGPR